MEKFINQESEQKLNFLSEKLKFSLRISKEAVNFLPEISEDDIKTKKEKFRFLLGSFNVINQEEFEVSIKGVFEDEEEIIYKEGKEEIYDISMPRAVNFVQGINKMPEFKDWKLIGEVHTHPCKPSEFKENFIPWMPSEGDCNALIENYKKGILKDNQPYIFGIAAPNESGETLYAYYRIIKDKDAYSYIKI